MYVDVVIIIIIIILGDRYQCMLMVLTRVWLGRRLIDVKGGSGNNDGSIRWLRVS